MDNAVSEARQRGTRAPGSAVRRTAAHHGIHVLRGGGRPLRTASASPSLGRRCVALPQGLSTRLDQLLHLGSLVFKEESGYIG